MHSTIYDIYVYCFSGKHFLDRIGYLAFAGGPPATKCAGEYLPKLAELLEGKDLRSDLKIAVLKVLSIITINHLDHQVM